MFYMFDLRSCKIMLNRNYKEMRNEVVVRTITCHVQVFKFKVNEYEAFEK